MADAEGLSRKRKLRAAHRASATRMIAQVQDMTRPDSGEELSMPKLSQKKQALQAKTEVLNRLDEEIVEMVNEDALEEEIEQADIVRERIELAILDLSRVLDDATRVGSISDRRTLASDRRTVHTDPPPHDPLPDDPPPHDPAPHDPDPPDDSPTGDGHSTRSGGESRAGTPTHSPSTSPLPPSEEGDHTAVTYSPRVKLPKLSLRRFNGDLTKWTTFWDTFQSAIHNNSTLTSIDKFNYLNSLLESVAAEAVSGLTLTAANYKEAIATLKRRFGNKQLIVKRHMDLLLNLESITSQHNLKGLRHLYDVVEANVRGLRALGVPPESYGGLLSSILMNKLPPELRLIVSRKMDESAWELDPMLEIVRREIEARERSTEGASASTPHKSNMKPPPTALSLVAGSSTQPTCVYCSNSHPSSSCQTVTDPEARKGILRTTGRCFICLRRRHISRNCRANTRCSKCRGRHHTSICTGSHGQSSGGRPPMGPPTSTNSVDQNQTTATMYVSSQTPVLLQTAKMVISDTSWEPATTMEVRAILDPGSQRSYVKNDVRKALNLRCLQSELLMIKTFGSNKENRKLCDVVELQIMTRNGESLTISAVVVPHICDPVRAQPITTSKCMYDHISSLDLADPGDVRGELAIDVLIGSDNYWSLVTGKVKKGANGPTAIETHLGWVLSGPVEGATDEDTIVNMINVRSTLVLKVDTYSEPEDLEIGLRRFWELESLGVLENEQSVYDKFTQQISFKNGRYTVSLPWKESLPCLPDNYTLCYRRLTGLLKRLNQNPPLLLQYDGVIRDQLQQGIVEVVSNPEESEGTVHYLPHHAVIRHDKETTKLRIVYDASARADGPSLNDCLYTGPNFGQTLLDILLRFRLHEIALVGDVEKAFLMISVSRPDRDALRFLWMKDVERPQSEVTVFRFTRVVFGVSASPFLLNATIDHHMKKFESTDGEFVKKFRRSVYVDDLTTSLNGVDSAYEFYIKSKLRMAEGGFNLRKFATNSSELQQRIFHNEQTLHDSSNSPHETNEQQPKPTRGSRELQVLGVCWNVDNDELIFDIGSICRSMKDSQPTKRNAVSLATRFFDPLGVISPISVRFKLLFQQICEARMSWDQPLDGQLLTNWQDLASDLEQTTPVTMPRCCIKASYNSVLSYSLLGFCDASQRAYAAVVYLRVKTATDTFNQFLCAKTRIAPLKKVTIPRLELLSALLLSRLISSVNNALEPEIEISEVICHTDSQVALCWIQGKDKEWRQFVQNRVMEIRALVPCDSWRHCPGVKNPADIPSRGISPSEFREKLSLWMHGPTSLEGSIQLESLPEECAIELKVKHSKKVTTSLLSTAKDDALISCENYSSLKKLLRVTAYVFKFIQLTRPCQDVSTQQPSRSLSTEDVEAALHYWLMESQLALPGTDKFEVWSKQFGLFKDPSGLWRCGGRLKNSEVSFSAKHPVLLDKDHWLTTLIVKDCHKRIMHGGDKATLTELRSKYWIVRGRQLVKRILHQCVMCRRYQGKPYQPPPAPPLPEFRVKEARPFSFTGVDFAGPMYVSDATTPTARKVWLCLYTCCVTRAAYLDIVPDMTAQAFIRSLKRFTSRRGFPLKIVSDNAKTFKAASKNLSALMESPEVLRYFSNVKMKWSFNLERAPWWGGVFERMIGSAKRCLKKTIGGARLTYDELLTAVTEVEGILNSRPLSYVSSEDIEEPLTPSHLLTGHRILNLPDPLTDGGSDFEDEVTREDLTRRMKHLSKVINDFWRRWRSEYLLELREAHRYLRTPKGSANPIAVGDIVIVHDENQPRGLWKLGKIEELIQGADGNVRGAIVKMPSGGQSTLRRSVQHLYPLEIRASGGNADVCTSVHQDTVVPSGTTESLPNPSGDTKEVDKTRPRRKAYLRGRERVRAWTNDENEDRLI